MATAAASSGPSVNERMAEKSNLQVTGEKMAPYLVFLLLAYCIADIGILSFRDRMLPDKAPPARAARSMIPAASSKAGYQAIVSRNIFNADGVIPAPLSSQGDAQHPGMDLPPVPSQLPLTLVGTIVMTNPLKSIANIEVKSKNTTISVETNKEIDNLATLTKVERNKITFRNTNNGRLEFIEIKSQSKLSLGSSAPTSALTAAKGTGEVKQVAPNKYKLSRASLLKHTADLSKLLMQASTIPRKKPNGDIDCYVLTAFQPDSIFADLGVQQGDCIKSVNGEPIDSPAKAMELYNALKNANNIKITVESDGRDVEKDYSIE